MKYTPDVADDQRSDHQSGDAARRERERQRQPEVRRQSAAGAASASVYAATPK